MEPGPAAFRPPPPQPERTRQAWHGLRPSGWLGEDGEGGQPEGECAGPAAREGLQAGGMWAGKHLPGLSPL